MRASYLAIAAAAAWMTGCAVGPNYQRPQVTLPANFRAPEPMREPQAASLADLKWFEVFHDEKLQELIHESLVHNYDLRDAVTRVDQARANLGITRSNQLPQVSASSSVEVTRLSRDGSFPLPSTFVATQNRNWGQAGLNLLSFELDIWGRLRRATEAARASLLNAEENRKAVVSTLVSEVASDYFQLLQLDYELEISQRTLETRRDSLRLVESRRSGGVATLLDLRQAEQLVSSAAESIPQLQQHIHAPGICGSVRHLRRRQPLPARRVRRVDSDAYARHRRYRRLLSDALSFADRRRGVRAAGGGRPVELDFWQGGPVGAARRFRDRRCTRATHDQRRVGQ